ncbi:alcohol dehydrogenase [Brucella pseudogrignonensis]|uniref:quinone oxidoreductase family protein n=1 Tax=Brucella pseudogrignonensis TaxID=419475 RepID=UPI0007DA745C|nr:quinone oxidoreductase [Brucella pseudogrignonensis]ANG96467.1 alcohol dehydrogenase [Brucella pseudogrignonensis]
MDCEILLDAIGEAELLRKAPHTPKQPGPGEVRIRHNAIGVNFVDIYHRTGLYPVPHFPIILGVEGAGFIEAVGDNVSDLKPGDRVAYAGLPIGAYASTRLLPADRALKLPEHVSSDEAAANLLRGITAHMLLTQSFHVDSNTTVLIHAAAGGLGTILTRWAKHLGATVIGTVSTELKASIITRNGADHVVVGRDTDFVAAIKKLTDGRGVNVAYDGIGGETLTKTAKCIQPSGALVSVGQAGGRIAQSTVDELTNQTAFSFMRPSVISYVNDINNYRASATELFKFMDKGIKGTISEKIPLAEAARAHKMLETGHSSGAMLLIP